jgi:hypothetical protein
MFFWTKHFFSDSEPHKDAAQEVGLVCGISLVPLLLLPLIEHLRLNLDFPNDVLWQAISSGQLYLYSFALLGTLHWLSQKDRKDLNRFPPRKYLSLFVWLPAIIMFIVYSFDPSLSKPLSQTLIRISIGFYLLYVVLYYVLLVFEKLPPPDAGTQISEETDTLILNYRARSGVDDAPG